MTVAATIAPSPGWYPDPQGDGQLRWWDGGSWTAHVTATPAAGAAPLAEPSSDASAEVPFVADIRPADVDAFDDDLFGDAEPIEFSWEDTVEDFMADLEEFESQPAASPEPVRAPEPEPAAVRAPEPEPAPQPRAEVAHAADGGSFSFRVRSLDPRPAPAPAARRDLPVYESPLATVASPLPVPRTTAQPAPVIVAPALPEPPAAPLEPPAPSAHALPAPPQALPVSPALPAPPSARPVGSDGRLPVPRRVLTSSAGLIVAAAAAAGLTNLMGGGEEAPDRAPAPSAAAITTADRACLKEWNTTASGTAAELRVTLGQFTGAHARIARVNPLPGTLMAPDSCALTVYDPATDTNAVFVSGVEDQLGYMDVTTYPRAETYGWPKSERQANVSIRADGSISAL